MLVVANLQLPSEKEEEAYQKLAAQKSKVGLGEDALRLIASEIAFNLALADDIRLQCEEFAKESAALSTTLRKTLSDSEERARGFARALAADDPVPTTANTLLVVKDVLEEIDKKARIIVHSKYSIYVSPLAYFLILSENINLSAELPHAKDREYALMPIRIGTERLKILHGKEEESDIVAVQNGILASLGYVAPSSVPANLSNRKLYSSAREQGHSPEDSAALVLEATARRQRTKSIT